MTAKDLAGQSIGDDSRGLARRHARELIFLEVGIDPQLVCWDDGQQMGARRHIGADLCGAISDIAINRRADLGLA
jgi:hypothetical protein